MIGSATVQAKVVPGICQMRRSFSNKQAKLAVLLALSRGPEFQLFKIIRITSSPVPVPWSTQWHFRVLPMGSTTGDEAKSKRDVIGLTMSHNQKVSKQPGLRLAACLE